MHSCNEFIWSYYDVKLGKNSSINEKKLNIKPENIKMFQSNIMNQNPKNRFSTYPVINLNVELHEIEYSMDLINNVKLI